MLFPNGRRNLPKRIRQTMMADNMCMSKLYSVFSQQGLENKRTSQSLKNTQELLLSDPYLDSFVKNETLRVLQHKERILMYNIDFPSTSKSLPAPITLPFDAKFHDNLNWRFRKTYVSTSTNVFNLQCIFAQLKDETSSLVA